jgi:excisionase family DNA binding protein
MSNTSHTKRLAEAVANIVTTIAEIIEVKIREVKAAGPNAAGPVSRGINTLTPAEGWVGKKEAAKHFNVSQRTLHNWMKKGVIPYVRIGRNVRFKLSDADEALKRRLGVAGRY